MNTNDPLLKDFKKLYIKTSIEYLDNLASNLQKLSIKPDDQEIINQIYIDTHSLKSQSIAMGFNKTGILAGIIEHIFKNVKDKQMNISGKLIKLLFASQQNLNNSINKIQKENQELDLTQDTENLKEKLNLKPNF